MSGVDSRSILNLFLGNKSDLLRYLTRKVGPDEAPDLLQEIFVRALRHERFSIVADPAAFLKQIAVNLARDFARRRRTERNYIQFGDDHFDVPSDDARPEDLIDYERKARLLEAAIETMPPKCREVFKLHIHNNVSFHDIARELQISDRMVRKHLSLAFRICRDAMRQTME